MSPLEREVRLVSPDQVELRDQLIAAGLLIPSGIDGVYGHSEIFESLSEGLAALVSSTARELGPVVKLRFPPLLPVERLVSAGYLANMPHLAGTIFSFEGTEREAMAQAEAADKGEDWSGFQHQTDLCLMPAACYPVYPAMGARGPLEPGGVLVDIGPSWVFRHEPSEDPARRQIFRMHELIRIGEPDAVVEWRGEWAERGLELLRGLGLDARTDRANDPFFGRRGRMLANNQRAQDLKLELLIQIAGEEPTACASFNHHLDHFGSTFDITLSDGSVAHTACLGFGHERIVLALLKTHGLDPAAWPAEVSSQLL